MIKSMKPSPPITIIRLDLFIFLLLNILRICFFIFKDLKFLSEIINGLFIYKLVPSARLELALPKGQGF